jgi:hypothetical protein
MNMLLLMGMTSLFAIHKQNVHFDILGRFVCMEKGANCQRSIEMGGRQDQAKGSPTQTLDEAKPHPFWAQKYPGFKACWNFMMKLRGIIIIQKKGVKSCVFFHKGVCGFFRLSLSHNPNLHAYPKDWALLKK